MTRATDNVLPLRKRKGGRKVVVQDGIRLTVFISPAQKLVAERVGHGNVSKGVRELIERAVNYENEHEQTI